MVGADVGDGASVVVVVAGADVVVVTELAPEQLVAASKLARTIRAPLLGPLCLARANLVAVPYPGGWAESR